jgi:hypothetical protein
MKKILILAACAIALILITATSTYHYVLDNYRIVHDNSDAYITIFGKTEYFVLDDLAPGKVLGIATYTEY